MTTRVLKVIKKLRDSPLPDIPINFPPFKNLHLELLEVKDKLKAGLPLIPLSKPKQKPINDFAESRSDTSRSSIQPTNSSVSDRSESSPTANISQPIKKRTKEEDELLLEIGDDEEIQAIEESAGQPERADRPRKEKKRKEKSENKPEKERPPAEPEDEAEGEEGSGEEGEEHDSADEEEDDEYAGLTPEEREAREREEYIWRFRILKKKYGRHASIPIPEWTEHSDLNMMKRSYERTIKELYLDDAIETYKTYLMGGWIVMEYVCTQFIGIDLRGFTSQQIKMMHKYDRLLIELGEKSYSQWGMNIPVEIRLLGMILFQAGIFYLAKVVYDKMGGEMAEMLRGITGQPPAPEKSSKKRDGDTSRSTSRGRSTSRRRANTSRNNSDNEEDAPKPGRKMKGPRMKAADIRSRANKETQ